MSTGDPTVEWTPGAGWERLKRELPGMVPDLSGEDLRKADEIIGRAGSTPVSEEPAAGSTGDRELTGRDAAEVPEHVYQEAAEALVGGFRVGSRNAADAYGYAAAPWLRAAVNATYARGISEGQRQAAAFIANEIRAELVCCDVYERLAPLRAEVEAARFGWGEAYGELSDRVAGHDICYWGEAAARIAEARDDDAGEPAEQPEGGAR